MIALQLVTNEIDYFKRLFNCHYGARVFRFDREYFHDLELLQQHVDWFKLHVYKEVEFIW